MEIKFSSYIEVFNVAMYLEEAGIKFYEEMSKKIKKSAISKLFLQLAKDEKKHRQIFLGLRDEFSKSFADEIWTIEPLEKEYLRNLVETGVFYEVAHLPAMTVKTLNEKDVFSIGIQAEKDSILFYTTVSEKSLGSSTKEAFNKVIQEEKKHLDILNKYIKELK